MGWQIPKIVVVIGVVSFVFSPSSRAASSAPAVRPMSQPFRLMSAEKDARLRERLPRVDDPTVRQLLEDPALILYTEAEMPPAYQDWGSGLPGVHSPSYNVSANGSEPFGNGNVEFPWGAPGGTHRTSNVDAFRLLWLPRDEDGDLRPIVWYRNSGQGYSWTFPVGTVVGEVLQITSPAGQKFTFELRLRTREQGEWSVDVFRPFPSSAHLAGRIQALRPMWHEDARLAELVGHLLDPVELELQVLADRKHSRRSFQQSSGLDHLPEVGDDALVAELLSDTVFESALGATWRTGTNGVRTAAPTTAAKFHVVPARYDAGFIDVDRVSCMRCHETVNHDVNEFDFGRDWYGRIRGSDGIFSIHPFSRGSISYNGSSLTVRMNDKLVKAGVLAKFDRDVHSNDVYHLLVPVDD